MSVCLLELPRDVLGEILAHLSLVERFSKFGLVSSSALALAYSLPLASLPLSHLKWIDLLDDIQYTATANRDEQAAESFFSNSPISRLPLDRVSSLSLPEMTHTELDLFVKYFPNVVEMDIVGLNENRREGEGDRSKCNALTRLPRLTSLKLDLRSEFVAINFAKLERLDLSYNLDQVFSVLRMIQGGNTAPSLVDRYLLAQIESATYIRHLKTNFPVNLSVLKNLESLEMVIESNLFLRGFTGTSLKTLVVTLKNNATIVQDSGIDPAFICPNLNFLAPSLRLLSFTGFRIPYDAISELKLDSLTVSDWVSFRSFRDQTQLTHLFIDNFNQNLVLGPEQFLVLEKFSQLRRLEVIGKLWPQNEGPERIMSYFNQNKAPHLKEFAWSQSYEVEQNHIVPFIKSLPPSITALALEHIFVNSECLKILKERLVNLQELRLCIEMAPLVDSLKAEACKSFPNATVSFFF